MATKKGSKFVSLLIRTSFVTIGEIIYGSGADPKIFHCNGIVHFGLVLRRKYNGFSLFLFLVIFDTIRLLFSYYSAEKSANYLNSIEQYA